MAAAYVTVLKLALSGKDTESGYGRYYIANAGEITWKEAIAAYAPTLKEKGIIDTVDPLLVTFEQVPMMLWVCFRSTCGCNIY